jgi:hypothetical protein
VYRAIDRAQGVISFHIDRVVFDHLKKTPAVGTIEFTSNPDDGDIVVIQDGVTTVNFEVDDDASVGLGNISVDRGGSSRETLLNLIDAINQNVNILAVETVGANPIMDLTQRTAGSEFNIPVTLLGAGAGTRITVTGMAGGDDDPVQTLEDYRRLQDPPIDPYPPGPYTPGAPFVGGGGPWETGGQLPYLEIQDLVIESARVARRFYDNTFLYNNEIFYNAGLETSSFVQSINLRRLVFELSQT